mmetsp:Transcript_58660/g.134155  ORF Transcript_58660/g.134155 Transcript_58660/m.134155 type:complete len:229 (-) Transcript_58660:252-938(-)
MATTRSKDMSNFSSEPHCPPYAKASWPDAYERWASEPGGATGSPANTQRPNHCTEYESHAVTPMNTRQCTAASRLSSMELPRTASSTSAKGLACLLVPSSTSGFSSATQSITTIAAVSREHTTTMSSSMCSERPPYAFMIEKPARKPTAWKQATRTCTCTCWALDARSATSTLMGVCSALSAMSISHSMQAAKPAAALAGSSAALEAKRSPNTHKAPSAATMIGLLRP